MPHGEAPDAEKWEAVPPDESPFPDLFPDLKGIGMRSRHVFGPVLRPAPGPLEWFDPMARPGRRLKPRIYIDLANVQSLQEAARFGADWGLLNTTPSWPHAPYPAACVALAEDPSGAPVRTVEWRLGTESNEFLAGESWHVWKQCIARLRAALTVTIVAAASEADLDAAWLRVSLSDAMYALRWLERTYFAPWQRGGAEPSSWGDVRARAPTALRNAVRVGVGELEMRPDHRAAWPPRFAPEPRTLLGAAWLQFGSDLSEHREWRVCSRPGCGSFFRVEAATQAWCDRCKGGYGRVHHHRSGDGSAQGPHPRAAVWPFEEGTA